jgi:Polyketide cyclase / dehydrase and lipid transport
MGQRPFTFITQVIANSQAGPEVVYDTVTDLPAHLEWSGERARDEDFKLLSLEASQARAAVGTTFTSSGANFNGTFHDRSVVTEASRPRVFVIDTDARLDRTRGKPWEVHFRHRYDIEPQGKGSRIVYTETIDRLNYVPYWLRWWLRPISRRVIVRADEQQLGNLARLAEERSQESPTS